LKPRAGRVPARSGILLVSGALGYIRYVRVGFAGIQADRDILDKLPAFGIIPLAVGIGYFLRLGRSFAATAPRLTTLKFKPAFE